MRILPPVELLIDASERLGGLCQEVVFLGGSVVSLLIEETGGRPPRITKDVDVAIQLSGAFLDVHDLDRRLLKIGFRNDVTGPVCRYLHGTAVIDVMTVNPEALGDFNGWYPLAIKTAQSRTLPNGAQINVISPVCFLGTKLVAFRSPSREYHDDIFLSRDFGDFVRVIDGRPAIAEEVLEARADLRAFLQHEFAALLKETYIEDAIIDHVDSGRERLVLKRIRDFLS